LGKISARICLRNVCACRFKALSSVLTPHSRIMRKVT
jgi:hypothetical protein